MVRRVVALKYSHLDPCLCVKVVLHKKSYYDVHIGHLVHIYQQDVGAYWIVVDVEYLRTAKNIYIPVEIEVALKARLLFVPLFIRTLVSEAAAYAAVREYCGEIKGHNKFYSLGGWALLSVGGGPLASIDRMVCSGSLV